MIYTVRQTDRHTDRLAQIDSILQSNLGRQSGGWTNKPADMDKKERQGGRE